MDIKELKKLFISKKILYVEDDEYLCEVNKEALELFCDDVFIAKDGEEGLELFKENTDIDLVLTDVTMERMHGLEMAKQIRKINPKVKIIARTSHSMAYLRENFGEYDVKALFDHTLQKPFDFVDLLEIIDKYIEPSN
jgi:CheY-like chemotaxis protein